MDGAGGGEVPGDINSLVDGAGGGEVSGDMFAYSALSVGYCEPQRSAGRQAAISSPEHSLRAYPCSLQLTFSNIPLCAHFAPQAPFVLIQVAASPPGRAPLGTPFELSTTASPNLQTFYRQVFGNPTPCRDGPFSGGALCASGGAAPPSSGSILIDRFVDGGTSGPSQVRGRFQGLVLSPIAADLNRRTPSLAAAGPIDRSFQATSCVVNLQPQSMLPTDL